VRQPRSPIFWTGLIAVIFVTTGARLRADTPSASSDADGNAKIVPVIVGGRKLPVRVEQQTDPLKNVPASGTPGKYDPQRLFSSTNAMANKSFSPSSDPLSHANSDFTDHDRNTFATKSYVDRASSSSTANPDAKASFPTFASNSRPAPGFDKNYATPNADPRLNRPAAFVPSNTAADQNRSAVPGGSEKPEELTASSMANKQYLGPGAQQVPEGIVIKDNIVISRMSGLPNRPLSIDEVRNLINHESKPDTDAKPAEPSKPLNDPDYKPEALRDTPSPAGDDDKNDPVPPPGTMAAPQTPVNSEPLPQP
jgi:hypothetical protein